MAALPLTWDKYRLNCGGKILNLHRPQVMGIINLTSDSYCSTGRFSTVDGAVRHAVQSVKDGAAILDVGAEATNPFLTPVTPLDQEMDGLLPVVEALLKEVDIPIAVDTNKTEVMAEMINLGVHMINDITALRRPGALALLAPLKDIPVCLMHMAFPDSKPQDGAKHLYPDGVVAMVKQFLQERLTACEEAGISRNRLMVDPGVGGGSFGKSAEEVLQLVGALNAFHDMACPLLLGVSRKSFINDFLGLPENERLPASLAITALGVERGALLIRAHDVKATVETVRMTTIFLENQS